MIQFVPNQPLLTAGTRNRCKGMAGELMAKLTTTQVGRAGGGIVLHASLPHQHRFLVTPASKARLTMYLEDACDCPVALHIAVE